MPRFADVDAALDDPRHLGMPPSCASPWRHAPCAFATKCAESIVSDQAYPRRRRWRPRRRSTGSRPAVQGLRCVDRPTAQMWNPGFKEPGDGVGVCGWGVASHVSSPEGDRRMAGSSPFEDGRDSGASNCATASRMLWKVASSPAARTGRRGTMTTAGGSWKRAKGSTGSARWGNGSDEEIARTTSVRGRGSSCSVGERRPRRARSWRSRAAHLSPRAFTLPAAISRGVEDTEDGRRIGRYAGQ